MSRRFPYTSQLFVITKPKLDGFVVLRWWLSALAVVGAHHLCGYTRSTFRRLAKDAEELQFQGCYGMVCFQVRPHSAALRPPKSRISAMSSRGSSCHLFYKSSVGKHVYRMYIGKLDETAFSSEYKTFNFQCNKIVSPTQQRMKLKMVYLSTKMYTSDDNNNPSLSKRDLYLILNLLLNGTSTTVSA